MAADLLKENLHTIFEDELRKQPQDILKISPQERKVKVEAVIFERYSRMQKFLRGSKYIASEGSTACVTIILYLDKTPEGQKGEVFVANAGDTRTLFVSQPEGSSELVAQRMSIDHRPTEALVLTSPFTVAPSDRFCYTSSKTSVGETNSPQMVMRSQGSGGFSVDLQRVLGSGDAQEDKTNFEEYIKADPPVTEWERIAAIGGFVSEESCRVKMILAVSRAFGDFDIQPFVEPIPSISSRPFVTSVRASPATAEDSIPLLTINHAQEDKETKLVGKRSNFIVMGCDGIWDEVTDEQAAWMVTRYRANGDAAAQAEAGEGWRSVAHRLRDTTLSYQSSDNVSAVVVEF
eukprot:TRINITY_DN6677_c0_g1_i1.p1 TRINITY_DN6677_c0_g1~~TRINITY_DN6677_c0_g1_i1.p1  ORF type:complete len:348 (-),score=101.76 TRINITY_DN6677_c0_g1_i1:49-1092(-)